jgi:hypothetical protein
MSFCPATDPQPCVSRFGEGAYNELVYQPLSRFWLFQSIETGIFVALAAILLASLSSNCADASRDLCRPCDEVL